MVPVFRLPFLAGRIVHKEYLRSSTLHEKAFVHLYHSGYDSSLIAVAKQGHLDIVAELEKAGGFGRRPPRTERKIRNVSFQPRVALTEKGCDPVRPLRWETKKRSSALTCLIARTIAN